MPPPDAAIRTRGRISASSSIPAFSQVAVASSRVTVASATAGAAGSSRAS